MEDKFTDESAGIAVSQLADGITGFAWEAFGTGHVNPRNLVEFSETIQAYLDQQIRSNGSRVKLKGQ